MKPGTNRREKLIRKISEAFDGIEYPSKEDFALSGDEERDSIHSLLVGKHWRDVRGNDFHNRSSGLPLLNGHVFRYYLPALLRNAMEYHASTYNDSLATFTLFEIEPDGIVNVYGDLSEPRIALLSKAQRAVVLAFWRYYFRNHRQEYSRRQKRDILHFWRMSLVEDLDTLGKFARWYAGRHHNEVTNWVAALSR